MTTPAGRPAWERASGLGQYGGATNKQNYQSQGVIDARTDIGAEHINRIAADLAALARTAAFAIIRFTANDTSNTVTVNSARLMTGVRDSDYDGAAPPTGFPSVTHVADGQYRLTLATSYTDDYGVVGVYEPRVVVASRFQGVTAYTEQVSANVWDIRDSVTSGTKFYMVQVY